MGARVLIVEDESVVAADLSGKLERMGHSILGVAASGPEAVTLAEKLRPELVLMDIKLRGEMAGTEAAQKVQSVSGAPIIFVTANASVFLREPSKMQAPGICVSKPFSLPQLQAAIDAVILPKPSGTPGPAELADPEAFIQSKV